MPNRVLFISDKKYLNSEISGGVQLCTQEYLTYLSKAGFGITPFTVEPDRRVITRLKIKAGIEVYERYLIDSYLPDLIQTVKTSEIKLLLFNQMNIAGWIEHLKPHLPSDVKYVVLSHGNESGDYLHDITKSGNSGVLKTWRLGKMLTKEYKIFSEFLDGLVVLSENEVYINQWLGAHQQLYLPRLLEPRFINRQPKHGVAGFVGTLDHRPNLQGLISLLDQLQTAGFKHILRLVGAPIHAGKDLAARYSFVEYAGQLSDEQLLDEIKTWAVFLNPVFWYARGSSTKLSQGINWGLPCITTPAGKRGYELYNNSISTLDNSPKTFASALLRALGDDNYLNALREAAIENAKHFNAERWTEKLRVFLNSL